MFNRGYLRIYTKGLSPTALSLNGFTTTPPRQIREYFITKLFVCQYIIYILFISVENKLDFRSHSRISLVKKRLRVKL